jgi:nicotinamide-nucleotide amidase
MLRESHSSHKIAILATGDEISTGDIINSNSQKIAKRLTHEKMQVGLQLAAPDTIKDIKDALTFLLQHHDAVIITGGLGPTSDDLTRYALSEATHQELIFDDPSWNEICNRLSKFGYQTPPESNRQQALFPCGATIIPNPRGTAAGCVLTYQDKTIFMLPGPPNECLPLVDSVVIPMLKDLEFSKNLFSKKWLLFGIGEGKIAEELDALAEPFDCQTGYRLAYPYIECKLNSTHEVDFNKLVLLVEKAIQPYLLCGGEAPVSELLKQTLISQHIYIRILDHATGGSLEQTIKTPQTFPYLQFGQQNGMQQPVLEVQINGLNEYWKGEETLKTSLTISINQLESFHIDIPFRDERVKLYAIEYACYQILKNLPVMH